MDFVAVTFIVGATLGLVATVVSRLSARDEKVCDPVASSSAGAGSDTAAEDAPERWGNPPTDRGWYRDPHGRATSRWWDGQRWTEETDPPQWLVIPVSPEHAGSDAEDAARNTRARH